MVSFLYGLYAVLFLTGFLFVVSSFHKTTEKDSYDVGVFGMGLILIALIFFLSTKFGQWMGG